MWVLGSLKDGSFLKTTFKNTSFKSVFKESLPVSCSLKCLQCRACSNISTRATVILSRLFFSSFMAILNEAISTFKAQRLRQCEVRRPGQTLLLSSAGGLTPGQTLQPGDLSSAMETSTNLVAFVSAQKKMPQINLALGIHLLLRLKTSSKACETARGSWGFM